MSHSPFEGVIAPVLTPFNEDLSVDTGRFVDYCKRLLDEGCHALAVFGTTSEANSLTVDEKVSLLRALVDAGIPGERLMPGTGACALPDAVRLTRAAVDHGAGGVLFLPPFYYKKIDEEGLHAWVSQTIRRVGDDRLRIYLYHIPQVAQVGWSLPLVARLLEDFPETIVGLKDSSNDISYSFALLERHPGFGLFVGSELHLAETLKHGGAGTITATANTNAAALRRYYDNRDTPRGEALNEAISAMRRTLDGYPLITAHKAIMARRDGDPGWRRVRPPLRPMAEADEKRLLDQVAALEALAPTTG